MSSTESSKKSLSWGRMVLFALLIPLLAAAVIAGYVYWSITEYQAQHNGRIFEGVQIWETDLSGLTKSDAREKLVSVIPDLSEKSVIVTDPETGDQWTKTLDEMGISYDLDSVVEQAYQVGRAEDGENLTSEQLRIRHQQINFVPSMMVDENVLENIIADISLSVDTRAENASLEMIGDDINYTESQTGRILNRDELRTRLLMSATQLEAAEIEIESIPIEPKLSTEVVQESAEELKQVISSPITLYVEQPVQGEDNEEFEIPVSDLLSWVTLDYEETDGKVETELVIDREEVYKWVSLNKDQFALAPRRSKFYFDDASKELVIVQNHQVGRYLAVEETTDSIMAAIASDTRRVPFALKMQLPDVHDGSTAAELGITELVGYSRSTFHHSSPERVHNVGRGASNFYGIVIAPGELFSFNEHLGGISLENGYKEGLIISGGRTVGGVGGGICQVSSTLYQAAFWGGFDIGSRNSHGYRVEYYEQALGPDGATNIGMDATIYSPIVDFTFTNNTENHILIESYFYGASYELVFKIYSTNIGRTVERYIAINNEQEAEKDIYEFNPELPEGTIEQVDWAVEGANVTITRNVYNKDGNLLDQDHFSSIYQPWANVYEYGPGIDPAQFEEEEEGEEGEDAETPEGTDETEGGEEEWVQPTAVEWVETESGEWVESSAVNESQPEPEIAPEEIPQEIIPDVIE